MSSHFQLNVSDGEGLSYAIDRALSEKFGDSYKTLNKVRQWQSIFNIINSEPQAEQTQANQKQFSSNDNNVKNYSHYTVHEGVYNLTQNTWNKIVSYVSQELNLTPVNNDNDENLTEDPEQTVKSNEENLRAILNEAGIQLNEIDFTDALSKYENKLALKEQGFDITDDKIKSDVIAYANGKQFERTEDGFGAAGADHMLPSDSNAPAETYELVGVKQALEYAKQHPEDEEGAYRLQAEGYQQFGNSQLQLYDTSGDDLVDFDEFIVYEQNRLNEELDDEAKAGAKKIFDFLDLNGDKNIDLKEMTLHGYAMSKITDDDKTRTGSIISYGDWWTTGQTLAGIGTDDQSTSYVKAKNRYNELRELGEEVVYNYKQHIK